MDFIEFKATEESQENQPLTFSNRGEMTNDEMENFIDDSKQPKEDVSYYRKLDPENLNDCYKFAKQTRDPQVAVDEDDEMYFSMEDQQPELYAAENRGSVEFDKFPGYEKSVKKFMESLKNFDSNNNPFFHTIIYGVLFHLTEGKILDKNKAKYVLGNDFYSGLLEIKVDI